MAGGGGGGLHWTALGVLAMLCAAGPARGADAPVGGLAAEVSEAKDLMTALSPRGLRGADRVVISRDIDLEPLAFVPRITVGRNATVCGAPGRGVVLGNPGDAFRLFTLNATVAWCNLTFDLTATRQRRGSRLETMLFDLAPAGTVVYRSAAFEVPNTLFTALRADLMKLEPDEGVWSGDGRTISVSEARLGQAELVDVTVVRRDNFTEEFPVEREIRSHGDWRRLLGASRKARRPYGVTVAGNVTLSTCLLRHRKDPALTIKRPLTLTADPDRDGPTWLVFKGGRDERAGFFDVQSQIRLVGVSYQDLGVDLRVLPEGSPGPGCSPSSCLLNIGDATRAVAAANNHSAFRHDWQTPGCRLVVVGGAMVHSCEFVQDFAELLLYSLHAIQNQTLLARSLYEPVQLVDFEIEDNHTIKFNGFMGWGMCLQDAVMTCNRSEPEGLAQPSCQDKKDIAAAQALNKDILDGQVEQTTASDSTYGSAQKPQITSTGVYVAILGGISAVFTALILGFWKKLRCPWEVPLLDCAESAGSVSVKVAEKGSYKGGPNEGSCRSDGDGGPNVDDFTKMVEGLVNRDTMIAAISKTATDFGDKCATVEGQIAAGGNGVVYKGQWRGVPVAIKTVIFQDMADRAGRQRQRVVFEAAISSSISHRNLVQTYSYSFKKLQSESFQVTGSHAPKDPKQLEIVMGSEYKNSIADWKLYIVQEYCDGGSLRECLDGQKAVDVLEGRPRLGVICQIALDVALGMQHLHTQHNIVHGDLTSKNILLKREPGCDPDSLGTAKVADFGLSIKMGELQSHVSNQHAGTPFYMAPELCHKGVLSKKADVFSFGVLMWEMYHSRKCYQATQNSGMQYHPRFPKFPTVCPLLYAMLCVVCLSPKPEDRPDFNFVAKVFAALKKQHDEGKFSNADGLRANNRGVAAGLGRMTAMKILELIAQQADIPLDDAKSACGSLSEQDMASPDEPEVPDDSLGAVHLPHSMDISWSPVAVLGGEPSKGSFAIQDWRVHLNEAYVSPLHCVVTVSEFKEQNGRAPSDEDMDFAWKATDSSNEIEIRMGEDTCKREMPLCKSQLPDHDSLFGGLVVAPFRPSASSRLRDSIRSERRNESQ
ncbi:unnamed protein product [Ostreobium quekettii]|uniref:Protein kinase domain-containing protein n=1 Tax=Ostreobium quekettii TaxID=121088 RepID=A0A8S1IYP8_9CHLO|nr:unnamed protein product [Ostreobium quekettii]